MNNFSLGELSLADRVFSWWYRIAAPPEVPDSAPLHDRMRVRGGKLTSIIFLIELIVTLINLSTVISVNPSVVPGLVTLLIILVVGVFLNRAGKTTIAGVLTIINIELGLGLSILHTPGLFAVLLCSFFVTSEFVAGSLLTPWVVLPLTLGNCFFIAALITFMPNKTPEMIHLLAIQPASVYVTPIALHITVGVITFSWASSTYREMRRAGNAEEVSRLTMTMALQQKSVEQEKRQLEESIQQIVAVHVQAANGNLHARVPLDQHNVLWSIAGSLNNLLARLQRWRQEAAQLQRNEQALQQLLHNIQQARRQSQPLRPYTTGTSLDALILEISKFNFL